MPTVRKPAGDDTGRFTVYLLAKRRGYRYGGRVVLREQFDINLEQWEGHNKLETWKKEVEALRHAARLLQDHAAAIKKYHSTQDKRRAS